MKTIEAKIINPLLGTSIPLPDYSTDGAAGIDLSACIETSVTIEANQTKIIPSGLAIHIHDPQLAAVLLPRSGLGIKHGVILANSVGLIDSDYQGEIKIGVWNRSEQAFTINTGDRICQLVFVPVVMGKLTWVNEFSQDSDRGEQGLGHTGHQ